jgi:prephenate dehydrogenase
MTHFNKVAIIGVGLLGGAVSLACKKFNVTRELIGYGRNRNNLEEAQKAGVIDVVGEDLKTAVEDADLVILCTPVGSLVDLARQVISAVKPGCILTDVGSVKGSVVQNISSLLPEQVYFIGSHPIAGGEQSGFQAASAELLDGAKCIVTPDKNIPEEVLQKVSDFWQAIGMKVICLSSEEHDLIYGAVSHLPHIVAYALMNTIGETRTENHDDVTAFSGSGLRDCTRIAASNAVMWRDICVSNKAVLLQLIDQFETTLGEMRSWIETENSSELENTFIKANKYQRNINGTRNDCRD